MIKEMDTTWNDGYNNPYGGQLSIDPMSGSGGKTVSVSDGENETIDRQCEIEAQSDVDPNLKEPVSVKQKGLRVPFCTGDGSPFYTGDEGTFNVKKVKAVSSWNSADLSPVSNGVDGNRDVLPSWNFYLIDTTQNTGEKIRPVGKLKKDNLLRFDDGSFAPTVGITEAMRAECDVELYLDSGHQNRYCGAGEFDPEKFYNDHGMAKLYNSSGAEVRVLRPWETTSTDYTIGLACDKDLVVVDGAILPDGKQWRGVIQKGYENSFGDYTDTSKYPVLPPTAISPSPVCSVNGKLRSFFYLYEGEANCKSSAGPKNCGNIFANGRTYPLVNNSAINYMQKARANNANVHAPYPFAEGGFFALDAYICYLESLYGTKYLHSVNFFANGISSTNTPTNETNWKDLGGVRYKKKGDQDWLYSNWYGYPTKYTYEASKNTYWSEVINNLYPKEQCMESQMAASFAVETGVQEGTVFEFYGGEYWYKKVPGALDNDMNVIVYKKMSGEYNLFDQEGNAANVDIEVVLRMSLFGGMNLSGDIFRYWQGGYEQVGIVAKQVSADDISTRRGHTVKIYMNPDQKSWHEETVVTKKDGSLFGFESSYPLLGESINLGDSYAKRRMPLSGWKTEKGGNLGTGECFYTWDDCYWADSSYAIGSRVRVAARFAGYAASSHCSPRFLAAFHSVANASRTIAGSAQCLLDLGDAV